MSIDRVQPTPDRSPNWEKEQIQPLRHENPNATQGNAASPTSVNDKSVQSGEAPKRIAARTTVWVGKPGEAMAQMQSMSEKLKNMQSQYQTNIQIEDVGQSMVVTRQELEKASRDQAVTAQTGSGDGKVSYWERLSVSSKARTINKLKDQLHNLELERSRLVKNLSEQVNSGAYKVSGEEILAGMAEDA